MFIFQKNCNLRDQESKTSFGTLAASGWLASSPSPFSSGSTSTPSSSDSLRLVLFPAAGLGTSWLSSTCLASFWLLGAWITSSWISFGSFGSVKNYQWRERWTKEVLCFWYFKKFAKWKLFFTLIFHEYLERMAQAVVEPVE